MDRKLMDNLKMVNDKVDKMLNDLDFFAERLNDAEEYMDTLKALIDELAICAKKDIDDNHDRIEELEARIDILTKVAHRNDNVLEKLRHYQFDMNKTVNAFDKSNCGWQSLINNNNNFNQKENKKWE